MTELKIYIIGFIIVYIISIIVLAFKYRKTTSHEEKELLLCFTDGDNIGGLFISILLSIFWPLTVIFYTCKIIFYTIPRIIIKRLDKNSTERKEL